MSSTVRIPARVPAVLVLTPYANPYQPSAPRRVPVRYHTALRVIGTDQGRTVVLLPAQVTALPDAAAWDAVMAAHAAFAATLSALATHLRAVGPYSQRLAAALAAALTAAAAPNPLTPAVLAIADPDGYYPVAWDATRRVPALTRLGLIRHTPKMLFLERDVADRRAQADHFPCADDAAWAAAAELHTAAQGALAVWTTLLARLGTYAAADPAPAVSTPLFAAALGNP